MTTHKDSMTATDREAYLLRLDDELLRGGVILSEWCSEIVRQTDIAFIAGANLAAILTATAGAETYLRAEYAVGDRQRLAHLIDKSPIPRELKEDLHKLRKYRNRWVHIDEPWRDEILLKEPEALSEELDAMAEFACRVLRRTIYENQWI
jgi:hypothetical protein